MNSRWPMVPLGAVLAKSDDWIAIHPDHKYQEVTVALWGNGARLRREVLGAEIASPTRLQVHTNQFIISRIDARNGATGLIPVGLEGAVVSNDFPVFTPDPERLAPQFLGWLSKTKNFVELCKAASEGTTNRVRLKEDRFLAMTISLPPLAEQGRLVERIDALAAKIEEATRLKQQTNDDHADFISSLNNYLANGRIVTIGDFLELHEDRVSVEAGKEYAQVGAKGFGAGLFPRESITAQQTTYKAFNRLYAGAVVLSQVKGWEGAIAVCPNELAGRFASPEYRTFQAKPDAVLPEYVVAIIPTPWFWQRLSTVTRGVGARRERIRPELFLESSRSFVVLVLRRRLREGVGRHGPVTIRYRVRELFWRRGDRWPGRVGEIVLAKVWSPIEKRLLRSKEGDDGERLAAQRPVAAQYEIALTQALFVPCTVFLSPVARDVSVQEEFLVLAGSRQNIRRFLLDDDAPQPEFWFHGFSRPAILN